MPAVPPLVGIPATEIDAVWPLVAPILHAACRRGRGKETPADIRGALTERDLQLWLVWDGGVAALAITEIVRHPCKSCCRIRFCTGRGRQAWQHHIATIECWAKANGCAAMELIARPSWSRPLKEHGYTATHVFLEKEL